MKVLNNLTISLFEIYKNRAQINEIGIINGKMGLCINLYNLGRQLKNNELTNCGNNLIDEIYEMDYSIAPNTFKSGLFGFGWGIEHLIQHGFLTGDGNQILEDLDKRLIISGENSHIWDYGFLRGLLGGGIYFLKRLENNTENQVHFAPLMIKHTLIFLTDLFYSRIEYPYLYLEPANDKEYWDLPVLLKFLKDLYLFDVYNSKVEKIFDKVFSGILNNIPENFLNKLRLLEQLKDIIKLDFNTNLKEKCSCLLNNLNFKISEAIIPEDERIHKKLETILLINQLKYFSTFSKEYSQIKFIETQLIHEIHTSIINLQNFNLMENARQLGFFDGYNGFYKASPILFND